MWNTSGKQLTVYPKSLTESLRLLRGRGVGLSCRQRAAQVSSEQLMEEDLQAETEEMISNQLDACFH